MKILVAVRRPLRVAERLEVLTAVVLNDDDAAEAEREMDELAEALDADLLSVSVESLADALEYLRAEVADQEVL